MGLHQGQTVHRSNFTIKDITLPNSPKSIRILQYADGTTLFLGNRTDLREALSEIKKKMLL